jgi:DNA repair protein RecO (recombination protein O)
MIEWREDGVLIGVRPHGESAAIVEMFTEGHGRHVGVVRGGGSRKMVPVLQAGAQLDVTWKARLDEHIGAFTVEPLKARAAEVMDDRAALAGLTSVAALLSYALPEREPHPRLYATTLALMDLVGHDPRWPLAYLLWERALLEDLGFGLDLAACAVTGATEDLVYVSPKSGRAVSRGAAGAWADRLLPLPAALRGEGGAVSEVPEGLRTTGYFLDHWLAPALGDRPVPAARARLAAALARPSRQSGSAERP